MGSTLNEHVSEVEIDKLVDVNLLYVSQTLSARDSIFKEMYEELNVHDGSSLKQNDFIKRTVPKEKLAQWLETVCQILDSYSVPLIRNAVGLIDRCSKRIDQLQNEKIGDQEKIIQLQAEIMEMKSNELGEIKSTVQTEMKSFSSVLKKNTEPAICHKTIKAAVKSVCDEEDRSKNVIVYGIEEIAGEDLLGRLKTLLHEIKEKPVVTDCVRVGIKKSGDKRPRPVKFSLRNADHVAQVLRSAKKLHTKEGYRSVYICPDRNVQERKHLKTLIEQLRVKRKSEPNRTHVIKNNKIVSFDINSVRPD